MSRPRKPVVQLAEITVGKNMNRYAGRIVAVANTQPIGKSPANLPPQEKKVWAEIVKIAPAGLLQRSDRMYLEPVSRMAVMVPRSSAKPSELV